MILRILLGLSTVIVGAGVARAQAPVPCPDFVVDSNFNRQYAPEVGADAAGNFVVVWYENRVLREPVGVFGRRYEAAGSPRGSRFPVSTGPIADSNARDGVAVASDGSFVVAWTAAAIDPTGPRDVKARRYGPTGAPLGDEFVVNTYTTADQEDTAIAGTTHGRFVVVWAGQGPDTSAPARGVFAQAFDAAGARIGPERRVNTSTSGRNSSPSVAMKADGSFVVVWSNAYAGILGQRYDAAGVPAGPEFVANTTPGTAMSQYLPHVALDANGNFVVVWTHIVIASWRAVGRRFDASGIPQGVEFVIGAFPAARSPRVAFESSGGFLATWSDQGDGFKLGIMGQRYSASAVPLGPRFVVNATTAYRQDQPAIASTPHGFVASWHNSLGDDVRASVECARLYTVPPCRLVDTRNPPGASGGPGFTSGAQRSFPVTGACGIPADARAVVATVTAVAPSGTGFFSLFPAGQALPLASTVNFATGRTRAGNAVLALGTDGQLTARCEMTAGSTGTTHLVLDVTGYFRR